MTGETSVLANFRNASVHLVETPKWVRCYFAGIAVADSKRVLILRSVGTRRGTPVYYFPVEDVRTELLIPSGSAKNDPHIGDAAYYNLEAGGRRVEDGAWRFGEPFASAEGIARDDAPDLRGYMAFVWEKLDAWFEEDEEVYKHARDPYKRIDCLPSSRHVRVVVGGETVAKTRRPVLLFEAGHPTRYYIPKLDVRMDLLRDSDTVTRCPYKGLAHYYGVEAGGRLHEDIAWYYPHATTEAAPIAGGYISFYNEQVDRLEVDGEVQTPPSGFFRY